MRYLLLFLAVFSAGACAAQSGALDPEVRRQIDAGNQAWVDGMKSADAAKIAATYAENALDCGPTGECQKGRAAILEHLRQRATGMGPAGSASVTSAGAVRRGDYVYEWGSAKAEFPGGRATEGRYLTVWALQPDGTWKIFRNNSIPPDQAH